MYVIKVLAIMILVGLLGAKLIGLLRLPDVTGYILAGLMIGPSVLGILSPSDLSAFRPLNDIALGFIAYNIGCGMNIQHIKNLGWKIMTITFFEAGLPWLLVTIVMMLLGQSFAFAFTIGSIASATAPAATILIINQYHARGQVVDTLIPAVALDDAFCILAFGIASSISLNLVSGIPATVYNMAIEPLLSICAAVLIGLVMGIIALFLLRFLHQEGDVKIFDIGMIFATNFIALHFGLSNLLALMCFGLVLGNFSSRKRVNITALDGIFNPVFVAFFCFSGANLNLTALREAGVLGVGFILARAVGKYGGARLGASISGMSEEIQKYLGFTLLPEAGVAIGLSAMVTNLFPPDMATTVQAIILAAVIVNEIVGPVLAKIALQKAGEIEAGV